MSDPWHIVDDPSHLQTVRPGWLFGMFGLFILVGALGVYLDSRQVKRLKADVPRHKRRRRETADIFRPIFAAILFVMCMAVATYFMGVWHLPEARPDSNTTKPWQQKHGTPPTNQ